MCSSDLHTSCLTPTPAVPCDLMDPTLGGACLAVAECTSFRNASTATAGSCPCQVEPAAKLADGIACDDGSVPGLCPGAVRRPTGRDAPAQPVAPTDSARERPGGGKGHPPRRRDRRNQPARSYRTGRYRDKGRRGRKGRPKIGFAAARRPGGAALRRPPNHQGLLNTPRPLRVPLAVPFLPGDFVPPASPPA